MGKGLSFLVIVAGLLVSGQPLRSQALPFVGSDAYWAFLRTAYSRLEHSAALLLPSKITFLADGGGDGDGDGGDGGGGSGTSGGSSDGGGTGAGGTGDGGNDGGTDGTDGGDSASNGAADAAAAAAATSTTSTADDAAAAADTTTTTDAEAAAVAATTTANDAPDAPSNNTDQTNNAPDQTDQTNVDPTTPVQAVTNPVTTPELAAIEDIATTDPRGGFGLVTPTDTGTLGPGGAIPPGGPAATAPVDVYIKAVIVSAAQSPWDAIKKAPGVRNVIVTGGIIALGKTPIEGEIPGGGPQPSWLRVIPDLDLCSGAKIPPVVPNVIDIRIMSCPIKITYPDGTKVEY